MYLTQREKDIINEFKSKVAEAYPDEVINIIVFGSKARGDASEESDIDILVVTASDDWQMADKIRDIGYYLELENNLVLSIQVVGQDHVKYLKKIRSQFIRNVEREGIIL
ncbi:MAG: nucleotidyltransferase domain-containing protein [Nitrospirota bacterium]|jgi:predicted nucleotidyltransferase